MESESAGGASEAAGGGGKKEGGMAGYLFNPDGSIPENVQIAESSGDCGHDMTATRANPEAAEYAKLQRRLFVLSKIPDADFLSFNEHKIAELIHAALNGLPPFDPTGEHYTTRRLAAQRAGPPRGGGASQLRTGDASLHTTPP